MDGAIPEAELKQVLDKELKNAGVGVPAKTSPAGLTQ
jgi:hypothetical protein